MLAINLDLILRRMLGRATCVKDRSTRLTASARILNIAGVSGRIRIGANTVIRGELMTFGHGGMVEIGDWCFVGENARIWSAASIKIGDRVMIAHDVNVYDNLTHPIDPAARHEQCRAIIVGGHPRELDLEEQPVVIEDDAWIGAGASVLKGVRIGRAAIVATRAVVTKDVPAYCIVAGNPAQIVRRLTAGEPTAASVANV